MIKSNLIVGFICILTLSACGKRIDCNEPERLFNAVSAKVSLTLQNLPDSAGMPRSMPSGKLHWKCTGIYDWTSGFWPGLIWLDARFSGDTSLYKKAAHWTGFLEPVKYMKNKNHDLGFMLFCSFGNGYTLTKNPGYRAVLLEGADSLATLFNPKVGTILSWPYQKKARGWTHNTIIDNMMNLELLFWAAKNGRPAYFDIAVKHAETTLKNQVRPDYSTWHVVVYDSATGHVDSLLTHQGYANNSMWARGQAWAIYGFTMAYRESGKTEFLDAAKKLAEKFTVNLPPDKIPYWDFDVPDKKNEPRDASAATIAASALLELASLSDNPAQRKKYYATSIGLIRALSGNYLAPSNSEAILMHSVGSRPHKSEVDYSIIYADYYYAEALLRWKELLTAHPELCN